MKETGPDATPMVDRTVSPVGRKARCMDLAGVEWLKRVAKHCDDKAQVCRNLAAGAGNRTTRDFLESGAECAEELAKSFRRWLDDLQATEPGN